MHDIKTNNSQYLVALRIWVSQRRPETQETDLIRDDIIIYEGWKFRFLPVNVSLNKCQSLAYLLLAFLSSRVHGCSLESGNQSGIRSKDWPTMGIQLPSHSDTLLQITKRRTTCCLNLIDLTELSSCPYGASYCYLHKRAMCVSSHSSTGPTSARHTYLEAQ